MTLKKTKSWIKEYGIIYLIGLLIIFGIKYCYSKADCNDLSWILTPTARWVGILGRISFEYHPETGYVSHGLRFIIAPSCSGVQFMIITFATLLYSFAHHIGFRAGRYCWVGLCLGISYLFTVFLNGIRIVLSVYLPYSRAGQLLRRLLTGEQLHTIIGIIIFVSGLLTIYFITHYVIRKTTGLPLQDSVGRWLPPIFWYFSIVLGIPLLNQAWQKEGPKFMEYALLITAVWILIVPVFVLISLMSRWRK